MNKNTKILAVCEMGSVRSAAFTNALKIDKEYDNVLNCGVESVHLDGLIMLCKWADVIYVTADRGVFRRIPTLFKRKVIFVNVGKDIWHNPEDARLIRIMRKEIDKLGL